MTRALHNNHCLTPMTVFIGTLVILSALGSSPAASTANLSATVTVEPRVEALTASAIPLGTSIIYPGEQSVAILALSIRNTYEESKSLSSVTVHDASRGSGTPIQLRSNIDSLFLFKDSDLDSALSIGDSLLASAAWDAADMALAFGDLDIQKDSAVTLLLAVKAALFPHDGDTVDVFLRPASDVEISDATPVGGADSLNSLGFGVFDGLIAAQLNTPATGLVSIGTGDTVYNVFTADIPRNGYATDTLKSFTIRNSGTADETDLEFMALFSDNGNGVWGGFSEENLIAPLEYIGGHWAAGNLNVPLNDPTTRFYLGAKTLPYPVNGATLILQIPEYGILVASRNDGPLDTETPAVDMIEIQSEEGLLVTAESLDPGWLIPGTQSRPIFALRLRNGNNNAVQLDSLDLELELIDPAGGASSMELESQFDSLTIYLDGDGDPTSIGPLDVAVGSAAAVDGPCRFSTGGLAIDGNGGEVSLSVALAANLDFARDGNTVDASLASEIDLFVSPASTVFGDFPLTDAAIFTFDAFPAEKVTVTPQISRNLYGGQTDIPVFDFYAPGNGYAADTLLGLTVENLGSVDDGSAIEALNLWADRLDDGFTGDDILVTALTRGTVAWTAAGFRQFVPAAGQRLIATVDVSDGQFDGGTFALAIPSGGMSYASGMVGPDDDPILGGGTHLIIPPQRITVVSVPTATRIVRPGETGNTILTFALYNGYINEAKTLRSVRFENISRTASDAGFADHEIGRLRLYYDADANRVLSGDPVIGSGYFQDGVLNISALNLNLPSESLAYFFVQSDLATDAIDSDSLGIRIADVADLGFQETVSINGDLPLTSGGWNVVDGSVKRQFEVLTLASRSVNPGENLIPMMTFRPASNGDQVDTLESVSVTNSGSADTSDVTNLRLWLDSNGDNTWQITDAIIGSFAYAGSWWGCGGFAVEIPAQGPTLFVTGDIQAGGTDGRTVSLSVPTTGCLYSSGNDGPIDSVLESGAQFTLTGSSLRVAHNPGATSYSVGQVLAVEFSATNLSASTMDNVAGLSNLIGNPALLRPDSTQLGPVSLAPADSTLFADYYTALAPGTVNWSLQAVDILTGDSSSQLVTELYRIQSVPDGVDLDFVSSMPATVTLGQKNIIPMVLGFEHADSDPAAAPAVLDSLSIQIYDGSGAPLLANDVFARMRLITDEMHSVEPAQVPGSQQVTFVFDPPILVEPGEERSLSAVVDIDSGATATDFALGVAGASSVIFRDANSGAEVPVTSAAGFPLMTTVARIDRPPDRLLVAVLDQTDLNVNLGQEDARLVRLTLRHPGVAGTAPIQFTGFTIGMEDDSHQPLVFADIFEAVQAAHQGNVAALLVGANLDTELLTVSMATPPVLGPGETVILDLLVDIRTDAQLERLRLLISDSCRITARNYSTGESVPVSLDTDAMPPGAAFPLYSGWIQLRYPARAPYVCLSSNPDASVVAGTDEATLMSFVLTYPGPDEYSAVRLHDLSLIVLDSTDLALDPRQLFDRLGYAIDSTPAQYQISVDPVNGQTVFDFGPDGILVSPSDSITIRLVADIESGVPYDHFLLRVGSMDALRFTDATDSSLHPVAVLKSGCESTVPFVAGPISILWPAGRPVLTPESPPLTLAASGQRNVVVFDAVLAYDGPIPRGDLIFESLTGEFFRRTGDGLEILSGSTIFESIRLEVNEITWANDSSLSTATFLLLATGQHAVEHGNSIRLRLEGDLRTNAPPGNYVYHFSDSTFIVFTDENVDTALYPVLAAGSYPVLSTELNITAADLRGSFSNYPNPFIPARDGATTFGYFLTEEADIEISLYTMTGEFVATVVDNVRKEGNRRYDEETWDGRNDRGLEVAPGTYICVVSARYVSGRQETIKRKVTVVR